MRIDQPFASKTSFQTEIRETLLVGVFACIYIDANKRGRALFKMIYLTEERERKKKRWRKGKIPREKTLNDDFKLQQSRATMSPTSRENGRKTWRGPRRWDIHTSALLIFRRLEVSRKTMEIQAFSSALADGIEISLRRRNPIVDREGSAIVSSSHF